MADLESSHYAPGWRFKESNQHSVTLTDPLVWRITHQSGPAVSRKLTADAFRRKADIEKEEKTANPSDYVDWAEAPEWAAAWAMDDDGAAFWFENVPTLFEDKAGAVWGDNEEGWIEETTDFFFPVLWFRKSLCIRDADEKAFDQMTLAEKMGAEDYALDEATEKAFMDALDRADKVHSPSHYNSGNIECIEAIEEALTEEEMRGYFKANCIKYLWRERYKNGLEDLRKAHWYLSRLIDNLED
jgi:hypothetical protein